MAIDRTLLVEYDLSKPGQNYPGLIDYLKSFPNWCHHLKSAWFVKTSGTAAELAEKLWGFLDRNDKLIVIDVTSDTAAWYNLPTEVSNWIKKNI